jgi:hypothetical protein
LVFGDGTVKKTALYVVAARHFPVPLSPENGR